jgi:hypothetical protein
MDIFNVCGIFSHEDYVLVVEIKNSCQEALMASWQLPYNNTWRERHANLTLLRNRAQELISHYEECYLS